MKKRFLISCMLMALSLGAWAGKKEQPDLIRVVDKAQGIDTIYTRLVLEPRYLFSDSMCVALRWSVEGEIYAWIEQADIEYFRHNGVMYEPRMVQLEDGSAHRLLMERDRGSKGSNALIYTLGKGREKRYYIRKHSDETLHPLATADGQLSRYAQDYLKELWHEPSPAAAGYLDRTRASKDHFRLAERIYRQHNDNYLRRFTWGVLAGLHLNNLDAEQLGDQQGQLCATAGLWADLPLDSWGFSLRAEVAYYAQSALLVTSAISSAYNYSGLDVPLLLRYTVLPMPGRVLPYVEGGVLLGVPLNSNLEQERKVFDDDGDFYFSTRGERISGVPMSPLLGVGVECRLQPKHSLWLGFRYRMPSVLEEYECVRLDNNVKMDARFNLKHSGLTLTLMYNL